MSRGRLFHSVSSGLMCIFIGLGVRAHCAHCVPIWARMVVLREHGTAREASGGTGISRRIESRVSCHASEDNEGKPGFQARRIVPPSTYGEGETGYDWPSF